MVTRTQLLTLSSLRRRKHFIRSESEDLRRMSKNLVSAAPRLLEHDPCPAGEHRQQMQRWSVHRSVCPSLFCEKKKKSWMVLLTRSSFSQRRIASSGHLRNKHRSSQWVYFLLFFHPNCSILCDYFSCFFSWLACIPWFFVQCTLTWDCRAILR